MIAQNYNSDGSFYRKFESGYVEQGGIIDVRVTKTFDIPFVDNYYTLLGQGMNQSGGMSQTLDNNSKHNTDFVFTTTSFSNGNVNPIMWRAFGKWTLDSPRGCFCIKY